MGAAALPAGGRKLRAELAFGRFPERTSGATNQHVAADRRSTLLSYEREFAVGPGSKRERRLPERILVVDDEPMVRSSTARILRRQGVVVETAETAEEALKLMGAARFDAVLSDLVMPGMGGIELLRVLRERWPRLPVLLMSGYSEYPLRADDPLTGFLPKPFVPDDLLERLAQLMACSDPPGS